MNWLSRFLHIKPASKTLCFHVGRGKVRGDLVRLLRDWQRFGVRDITFDRTANTINARVDKINRKSPFLLNLCSTSEARRLLLPETRWRRSRRFDVISQFIPCAPSVPDR